MTRYHIQSWVQRNTPKLVSYAQSLSKPALTIGAGALSLVIELLTIFILVLLLLLEAPEDAALDAEPDDAGPGRQGHPVAAEVNRAVAGYMLGNFLTSLIAGIVVFVTLLVLGVPYPLLWGLWVALVDFLPMIGGALAGIPTALFAFTHSLTAGIVTAVVFLAYTAGREPHPEPGDHGQDGEDQPAAGADRGAGRRVAGQPGGRPVRRLRRGACWPSRRPARCRCWSGRPGRPPRRRRPATRGPRRSGRPRRVSSSLFRPIRGSMALRPPHGKPQ